MISALGLNLVKRHTWRLHGTRHIADHVPVADSGDKRCVQATVDVGDGLRTDPCGDPFSIERRQVIRAEH
jgi:hypothetical protein